MQFKSKGFIDIPVIIVIAVVVGIVSIFVVKKDDQVIEEVSESLVEQELGLPQGSVDFTPSSKE